MKTLAEEYVLKLLIESLFDKTGYGKDENKLTKNLKFGAAWSAGIHGARALGATAVAGGGTIASQVGMMGGGIAAVGAYHLYRKHKKAKMQADAEKDPAKKNELNVRANQLKQDASKKKVEDQKKDRLQKQQQSLQQQAKNKQGV